NPGLVSRADAGGHFRRGRRKDDSTRTGPECCRPVERVRDEVFGLCQHVLVADDRSECSQEAVGQWHVMTPTVRELAVVGDGPLLLFAEAFPAEAHHTPGPQEYLRLLTHAHARGRAGRDDVAG